jgi:hypothetical protein
MILSTSKWTDDHIYVFASKGQLCVEYSRERNFGRLIHPCKPEIKKVSDLAQITEEIRDRSVFLIDHPSIHHLRIILKSPPKSEPNAPKDLYTAYNLEENGEILNQTEATFTTLIQNYGASKRRVIQLQLTHDLRAYFQPNQPTDNDACAQRNSLVTIIQEAANYVPPKPYDPFEL